MERNQKTNKNKIKFINYFKKNFLMDYSPQVQNTQYTGDINFFLARPKIGVQETRLGTAETHQPLMYLLTVLNSSLLLTKCKWHNFKYSFLLVALASYPISVAASKYIFGFDKYRTVAKNDEDTRKSVEYYINNADLKK